MTNLEQREIFKSINIFHSRIAFKILKIVSVFLISANSFSDPFNAEIIFIHDKKFI